MDASSAAAGKRAQAPPATLLEVRDLRTVFRTEDGDVPAVDGVSFTLARGRTLGIVGESGCGKSVTSLSIMGLVPQPPARVSGEVRFEGVDLLTLRPSEMRELRGNRLAMIFQEPMTSLNPAFTIGDQIIEAVIRHRRSDPGQARARAIEMLKRVRIPAPERRIDEYPHKLSGGMRQRAMIAMALALDPELLIADEPTTALDVTIQAQILDLLRELQQAYGMAIVLITHDMGVVAENADRVIVMYAGRKVEEAEVDDLFERPAHPYTRGLLASIPHLDEATEAKASRARLSEIKGLVPSLMDLPQGCSFAPRCSYATDQCQAAFPPLEERWPGHWVACWHAARLQGPE